MKNKIKRLFSTSTLPTSSKQKKLLIIQSEQAQGYFQKGNTFLMAGDFKQAIENYRQAILIKPDFSDAHCNLGVAFKEIGELDVAIESYHHAISITPNDAEIYSNLGEIFWMQNKLNEAIECYQKALVLNPNMAIIHNNLGIALKDQGNLIEAIESYQKALWINPDYVNALDNLILTRMQCCDWTDYLVNIEKAIHIVNKGQQYRPFNFFSISASAFVQQQCAKNYARNYPISTTPLWNGEYYPHDKIRVAYISGDFRDHAVSYLMAGVFEQHNKERFEIIAISLIPEDKSAMGQRVKNAFNQFIDVSSFSNYEVAELIKKLEIDIAIDLMGFTRNCRTEIFSYRPAPIQVNYLGFSGTMGMEFIDYIIADKRVIPPEQEIYYTEKVVYLPDSYMANDCNRVIPNYIPMRAEVNLPDSGFVFCCFNNYYKLNSEIFALWMRLLSQIENSVLWLSDGNTFAMTNLRKEAIAYGISPNRLIFAPKVEKTQDHLARYKVADLFLDTLPYNAHTTTSDALWTGLPVLTCPGEAFASRVAASLLHAIGLPELITQNLAEYEALALKLATHPQKLAEIKAKLARNRDTYPLFDTNKFCNHLESAYITMCERVQRHELPISFSVDTITIEKIVSPNLLSATLLQVAIENHQAGDFAKAEINYKKILQIEPNHIDALHFLGILYYQTANNKNAIEFINKAIQLNPAHATATMYSNLGAAYQVQNELELAIENFTQALVLNPNDANAHYNLGVVLYLTGKTDEAINSYEKAILIQPNYPDAYYNLGHIFQEQHRFQEASKSYQQTLLFKKNHLAALLNLGILHYLQYNLTAAIECYEKVLFFNSNYADAYIHLGNAFNELNKSELAIDNYKKALLFNPNKTDALQSLFFIQLQRCDWLTSYVDTVKKIIHGVEVREQGHNPSTFIAVSSSVSFQQKCAEHYAKNYPLVKKPLWAGQHYQHRKIRLAYVSADFREHAVSYLMAGIFEQHNRERFEVIAISLKGEDKSPTGQRIKKAFNQFIDISKLSNYEAALLIRQLEIDIAIDLMGFTKHYRLDIFAYRPAPIQINYLGFPGTMGAEYIDYILADNYLIPSEYQTYYTEKVVYLPDSYLPNDSKRIIANYTPNRAEVYLPPSGFIFCCFNNSYKITPDIFTIWMRLLNKVENSVLWLSEGNSFVVSNLCKEAIFHGIAPERLIFAPKMKKIEEHLARQKLADLFLDTPIYNAHTTASDALWAGLPVLTCMGESFASRVAGSLLNAIGLPELITQNLADYEALALKLATHPQELAKIKAKLAKNRDIYPLFNTKRFTRHLESAYITMWERNQQGKLPVSFNVSPINQ